ncbi:DUF2913 family protein [Escherichia coli]
MAMKPGMSTTQPDSTLADLSHLAFCALAALGLARQEGKVSTPYAETLFLIRWLTTAQKQKRFPKSVAVDIAWLLERGRRYGAAAKLRQHLDYLWRSASGNLAEQSALFRLTYVTETLKDSGWENRVLNATEWKQHPDDLRIRENGFMVEKLALHRSFDTGGHQTESVEFRVVGDTDFFVRTLRKHGFTVQLTGKTKAYDSVTMFPYSSLAVPVQR